MVELVMTLTLVLVGLSGFLHALVGSMKLGRSNRTSAVATEALQAALEELASVPFNEVVRRYNADPADDPGGAGSAPGDAFSVNGLPPQPDDVDGMVGEIVFPFTAAGELTEAPAAGFPGMPRDLNLDGDTTDTGVVDYKILPVLVRLRWRDAAGDREAFAKTILIER